MIKVNNSLKGALLAGTIISGIAFAAPALAQDAQQKAETVVVTGSRLVRPNETAPTGIQVIDAKVIEATGEVNTGDLLRSLPAIGVQGLTATNSNFFTQGNGVSTIDMRNLGTDRTLVLVNGRRFVAGLPGTQNVDFNSIPTDMISRIDVVTGGASAVYGSDALAGVINVITQKRFEGFNVFGQYGKTERNDQERYKIGIKYGSNFANDRGNFVSTLSLASTGAVYARNRGEYGMDQDGLGGAFFGEDTRDTFFPFPSSFIAQGFAAVPRTGLASLSRVVDTTTGAVIPYAAATHGFNRQNERLLYVPNESLNFQTQVNYDFNEKLSFWLESSYYIGRVKSDIEPTPLASSDLFRDPNTGAPQAAACTGAGAATLCRFGVSINSLVVPVALANAVRAANPGALDSNLVVGFQRRLNEFGNRQNTADRNTARIAFGFDGKLDDTTKWDVSLTWGRTTESQMSAGQVIKSRVLEALDVVNIGGVAQCASATARANGCAPWYVFELGGGPRAAEAVKYMGINARFDAFIEEFTLAANLQGETKFELPGGGIRWSMGTEFRTEASRNTPDTTLQLGLSNSNIAPETKGDFEVKEIYGELKLPLAKDLPFMKSLDLNLAARASDYTTVGNTNAYAASLEYQALDWLKFRGQFSKAVRAPNIGELFAGRSQTFPAVTDVCRGLTTSGGLPAFLNNISNAGSGVNAATINSGTAIACFADAALAARVARDGSFVATQPELQGVGGFNEGNATLGSETSESTTLGFLFNSRYNQWTENFRLSVDYYSIHIEDAIQGYGRNLTISRCYGGSTPSARDPFYCQFLQRYGAGTPNVGALYEVNQKNFNIGGLWTQGIDVQASYGLEVNKLPFLAKDKDYGRFNTSVIYQHLMKYETQALPGGPRSDSKGNVGIPVNAAEIRFLYEIGKWNFSADTTIKGKTCFFGTSCDSTDYVNDLPIKVNAFTDMQVRYEFSDKTVVYFGADNVFDEFIRIGQGSGQPTGWATDPTAFDGLGRRFYMGFRKKF